MSQKATLMLAYLFSLCLIWAPCKPAPTPPESYIQFTPSFLFCGHVAFNMCLHPSSAVPSAILVCSVVAQSCSALRQYFDLYFNSSRTPARYLFPGTQFLDRWAFPARTALHATLHTQPPHVTLSADSVGWTRTLVPITHSCCCTYEYCAVCVWVSLPRVVRAIL